MDKHDDNAGAESYVCTDNGVELLWNMTLEYKVNKMKKKILSDGSCSQSGSRVDVHLSRHI